MWERTWMTERVFVPRRGPVGYQSRGGGSGSMLALVALAAVVIIMIIKWW